MTNVRQVNQTPKCGFPDIEAGYAERLEEARVKLLTAYNRMLEQPTEHNQNRHRQRKLELARLLITPYTTTE
jgi:hypothetical protein